jgi:hypothetical protein
MCYFFYSGRLSASLQRVKHGSRVMLDCSERYRFETGHVEMYVSSVDQEIVVSNF